MSLRLRLTLTYGLLLVLVVAAFGSVLFFSMSQALQQEMDRRLEVRAGQVQLALWHGAPPASLDAISSSTLDLSPLGIQSAQSLYVQIVAPDGVVRARSTGLQAAALPVERLSFQDALSGRRAFNDVVVGGNHPVRILSVPIAVGGSIVGEPIAVGRSIVGVLQVGQSQEPLRQTMEDLGILLLVLGGAAVAVAVLFGWAVARSALLPLKTMAQRAADIAAQGEFRNRVGPVAQRDEIGQLAMTVDHLLETVEQMFRKHQEFVADTSHELRNPLLAVRANLELLPRAGDAEAQAECLAEAAEQVERMSRLVNDLLLLARSEAGEMIQRRPFSLRPLVDRVVQAARHGAGERRVEVGPGGSPDVYADEGRVSEMLANLVDNAIRHTGRDGAIEVAIGREAEWALIKVTDDGEGISLEALPHIFERFYRAAGSASSATGGTGLGLAIVKHLAEAHGGRVTVTTELGKGSCFTLWLPVANERAPDESLVEVRPAGASAA